MEQKDVIKVFKKKGFFKKMFKRKTFWVVLVLVIALVVFGFTKFGGSKNLTTYTTEDVKSGLLVQTVNATGEVQAANDIDLGFKAGGRLVYLGVDEGSVVKSGQVLASVNSAGLSAQIAQYRANLDSANADLKRIQAGASAEEIKVTEEQVAKAQNDLNNLRNDRETQILNYKEKMIDAINNGLFTGGVALNVVYGHLIDGNNTINLLIANQSVLNRVKTDYSRIKNNLSVINVSIQSVSTTNSKDEIIVVANLAKTLLSDLNSWLDDAYTSANDIVINSNYTQTQKDAVKTDVKAQQSINNTSLTGIESARSNLVNSESSYNSQIQSAQDSLAIYQAQLDLKKAGPRDFEIEASQAKVTQAMAQLNIALASLDDYSLVAPIDGIVIKINYNIGEQVSLTTPAIKMISSGKFEVKVDIPESDVAKVKVGDKTVINFDAFGSDKIFNGTIAFIDPAQTVIQDVIYYKTTIVLNDDSLDSQIKPGMSADITIRTAEKNDVIYIPQRAVRIREAVLGEAPEKFVEVLVAPNTTEERVIEVGLRGDNGLVEITSGLKVGEKVVTFKKVGK